MAGTGKTTIAYSFCEWLDHSKKLAASFFCSRQLPSCRDVNRIVPTISYQLSRFSRPFQSALSRVLEEDPDLHNQVLLDQFRSLILQPLDQVKDTLPTNLIVVIDALDECENNEGVDRILNALLSCARELPVKFFVASRPDAKILDRMRGQHGENITTELRLHELDRPTVQEDIKTYLTTKLMSHMSLSAANLDILVQRSGVLFIYASTVARYLENDNFSRAGDRLEEIIKVSKHTSEDIGPGKGIHDLYTAILKQAFDSPSLTRQDWNEMKLILDTVVCSKEPLSIDVMAGLLGLGARKVRAALRPLFSVLHLSDIAHTITTLHESFPDYLLDKTRSEGFHCDANKHNAQLARLCFEQIKVLNPPFNICNLESSYVLDKDVQDLPARVERAISRQLLYACRYWVAHCMLGEQSLDLANMLREFASKRFLLWMEVVNLSGCLHEGVKALYNMRKWSMSAEYLDEDMRGFLRDMCEFATSFSSSGALLSTPHLYVSTLTFWRDHSPIIQYYGQQRVRLITQQSTAMSARRPAPLAILHPGEVVLGVAYSPDGAYVVSGSQQRTIRIWDAYSGQPVGQPLEGHIGPVNSVAYSPDGAYIVSGSWDSSVRIWDAHTRQPVGQPLEGHTGSVNSVAYSPDGAYIVSGSEDTTIRIWNAHTGQPVGQPLEGQPLEGRTHSISSVAYSSNGAYIVSGSHDSSLCIWNTRTRQPVAGRRLQGHDSSVNSVAYLPGGTHVISGSGDSTIRIWDAYTGQPVGQPLKGHTDCVICVAYSPDGAYVVSGSSDRTIRIWNSHTGQPAGQPLEGHTNRVYSVAYSPDGAYIVSGSDDKTIRVWNAHTGQPVGQLLEEHNDSVQSVVPSSDGASIAPSPSFDTVRICGAQPSVLQSLLREPHHTEPQPAYSLNMASKAQPTKQRALCNLGCRIDCSHMLWRLNEDGWIVFGQNKLIWVPHDLRETLVHPESTALVSKRGFLQLDLDRNRLGEHWHEYFQPGGSIEL
ncbi:hypothetical protein FRC12_012598 [Ceratobasidium sp. 428]|nr:hypothetical protein FRC12_012598 [Ceratobasidium sp. 428]